MKYPELLSQLKIDVSCHSWGIFNNFFLKTMNFFIVCLLNFFLFDSFLLFK